MEPIQAMLRMMQQVVEREWVQKTLYDIGWSDDQKCRCVIKKRCTIVRHGGKPETRFLRDWREMGTQGQTSRRRTGHGKEA